jgi:uncharacterized protein YndB with AHSA1/START domain
MEKLEIKNEIFIQASPEKVWDLLTNPQQTKKYMFGCETVSDWKIGSDLLWRGEYQGQAMVFVKGKILDLQINKRLLYTVIDPNNTAIADVPENYLQVDYLITPQAEGSLLTVIQGDYNKVAEGQKRYEESYNGGIGWQPILDQIKAIAEA